MNTNTEMQLHNYLLQSTAVLQQCCQTAGGHMSNVILIATENNCHYWTNVTANAIKKVCAVQKNALSHHLSVSYRPSVLADSV